MTKTCILKLVDAGFTLIRMDLSNNTIKVLREIENPNPIVGRGGYSWKKLDGPFPSKAATERRFQEILDQEPKTIQG